MRLVMKFSDECIAHIHSYLRQWEWKGRDEEHPLKDCGECEGLTVETLCGNVWHIPQNSNILKYFGSRAGFWHGVFFNVFAVGKDRGCIEPKIKIEGEHQYNPCSFEVVGYETTYKGLWWTDELLRNPSEEYWEIEKNPPTALWCRHTHKGIKYIAFIPYRNVYRSV